MRAKQAHNLLELVVGTRLLLERGLERVNAACTGASRSLHKVEREQATARAPGSLS